MIDTIRDNVWTVVILSLVVSLALSAYADIGRTVRAFLQFDWMLLPVVVLTTVLSLLVQFVKWDGLLRVVGIRVPLRSNFSVFWSALIMVISPGKVGEVWRSWQLTDRHDVPIDTSLPVVAVTRVADLIAVLLLASVSTYAISGSTGLVLALLASLLTAVLGLRHRPTCHGAIDLLAYLPYVCRFQSSLRETYDASVHLFRTPILGGAVLLSVLAYLIQSVGLLLLVSGFGSTIDLLSAVFVFTVASVAGTFSFLPGGIGVTEGSTTALLVALGVSDTHAVGTAILMRVLTTWFTAATALVVIGYDH